MSRKDQPCVLVVDNVTDAVDSTVMLLHLWGYRAEGCYQGMSALAAARAYRPDVVLLDLAMPGKDGFQIARELRACSELPHAVLIAVTGYANQPYRVRAHREGFHFYLVKPVEPDDLHELLIRVVGDVSICQRAKKERVNAVARLADHLASAARLRWPARR